MVRQEPEHRYIFVIDTEQYAGNFERDLCAYCTGEIGDCGRGDRYAKLFAQEVPEATNPFGCGSLDHRPDDSDNPCLRPCAIWPTPGWYNTGLGGHFRDDPANDDIALAQCSAAAVKYEEDVIAQVERNRSLSPEEKIKTHWTDATIDKQVTSHKDKIEKIKAITFLVKHPAYLSIAIFFYEKPNEAQVAMIKSRALRFSEARKQYGHSWECDPITITGFRLIDVVTTLHETSV